MAFLITEAYRLLRTIWQNPNDLAEELSTMLAADGPVVSTSPMTFTNPDTKSTMTVHPPTDTSGSVFTFNFGSGDIPVTPTDLGVPTTGKAGDPKAVSTTGGGGIPSVIISGIGDTYVIDLYENGKSKPASKRVTATQLQIDPAETIPAGSSALATKVAGAYYLCVPVFL